MDLAIAAGVTVAKKVTGKRAFPNSKYFVGLGKLRELEILILECCFEVSFLAWRQTVIEDNYVRSALQYQDL